MSVNDNDLELSRQERIRMRFEELGHSAAYIATPQPLQQAAPLLQQLAKSRALLNGLQIACWCGSVLNYICKYELPTDIVYPIELRVSGTPRM
jgi:hypothetical protein